MKKNVLNIRILGIAFSLMACFSACSNVENIEQNDGQPVEIKLSSGVTPESRALTPTQSTQIESGETVYVWAEKNSDKSSYIDAWSLTADGSGELTSTESKFYPKDRTAIDLYALHGNFSSTPTGVFQTEIPEYSVIADQSDKLNYVKSDLLYATKSAVSPQEAAVALVFKHLLSKIEINLIAGNGVDLSEVTSVKVLNTQLAADITLETSEATATAITPTGDTADITAYKSSDNDGVYAEAIVIPQEVSGTFVGVTVGGTPYYYTIPTKTLQGGYKYILDLTVGESTSVTPAEQSWTE